VLKEETIAHMPKDMVEALGEAKIATDYESFRDAYRAGGLSRGMSARMSDRTAWTATGSSEIPSA
jgi:hypothetical protein